MTTDPLKRPGDQLTWWSGNREKTGTVLCLLGAGERIFFALNRLDLSPTKTSVKAQDVSTRDRYLVEVPRGGKSGLSDYYAPEALVIDNKLREAAARRKMWEEVKR